MADHGFVPRGALMLPGSRGWTATIVSFGMASIKHCVRGLATRGGLARRALRSARIGKLGRKEDPMNV